VARGARRARQRDDPDVTDLVPISTTTPPPRTPWYRSLPTVIIAGAVVLVLVLVALLLRATPRDADRSVAVERDGRNAAVLVVATGADSITVTGADLGGDLAVASTPDGSSALPIIDIRDDEVTVNTADVDGEGNLWDGGDSGGRADGPVDVTVQVAEGVRWDLVVAGGSKRLALNLGDAEVTRVEVRGGQGAMEATLPKPAASLPVTIGGGAGSVALHVPAGVPARVTLQNGAGSAALDADRRQGIANGTVLTTPDWPTATGPRVDITATTGLGTFTLDRR
jgi:hypothetical protein